MLDFFEMDESARQERMRLLRLQFCRPEMITENGDINMGYFHPQTEPKVPTSESAPTGNSENQSLVEINNGEIAG